jgi:hypothetical protein
MASVPITVIGRPLLFCAGKIAVASPVGIKFAVIVFSDADIAASFFENRTIFDHKKA